MDSNFQVQCMSLAYQQNNWDKLKTNIVHTDDMLWLELYDFHTKIKLKCYKSNNSSSITSIKILNDVTLCMLLNSLNKILTAR